MSENERREEVADTGEIARYERYAADVDIRQYQTIFRRIPLRRGDAEEKILICGRRFGFWREEIYEPGFQRDRADYDVGDRIGLVKRSKSSLEGGAIFDLRVCQDSKRFGKFQGYFCVQMDRDEGMRRAWTETYSTSNQFGVMIVALWRRDR